MNWSNKKVLVTGAGGFIGSHLVELLKTLKADVRVFIRYTSHGTIGNLTYLPEKNFEIIYGDLRNPSIVKKALKDVDIVFHLASLISIPYSYSSPQEYFDVNVNSILNILEFVRDSPIELVIHTSTSEVYGSAQFIPITENHPLVGQSPYSASKISADKVAESFNLSFDTPVLTIRPFNNYGPRQSTRAIIPTIINQLLQSNNIRLGDLSTTRDFLYVKDTALGYVSAAENKEKLLGGTFNLGTGQEISMEDLVNKIGSLMDRNPEITINEQKLRPEKSEVMRLLSDSSSFSSKTNWTPKYSLKDGLKETIDFYRLFGDKFLQDSTFI